LVFLVPTKECSSNNENPTVKTAKLNITYFVALNFNLYRSKLTIVP